MREELFKGLSEEQIAKIKACKSQEEVFKVAKEEDIELTGEQLEAVSGGCGETLRCPDCGSEDLMIIPTHKEDGDTFVCRKCYRKFTKREIQTAVPAQK